MTTITSGQQLKIAVRTEKAEKTETTMTLQVIITADGHGWAAQALEIDYAACGDTVPDTKVRFLAGLEATANAHLNKHGNLANLRRPTAPEVWTSLAFRTQPEFTVARIEREPINLRTAGLEFDTVAFIVR